MGSEDFENLIIDRTKFLACSNACSKEEEIRPYALQAIKEFLPVEVAQCLSFDISIYDYVDFIIKKVLE